MIGDPAARGRLPRTVVVLGFVSFLNDGASEMVAPLIPVFLTAALGAGPAVLGLIEGVAEALASVLKYLSGRLVDLGWQPKRLVVGGYGVANLARPLIGFAVSWPYVLLLRAVDRIGKGIRTAPRDALLAGSVEVKNRGRAFGFHRSMDHAGAVLGPLLAFALMSAGVRLERVFFSSALVGLVLMLLVTMGIPGEARKATVEAPVQLGWRGLDPQGRLLVGATGALAFSAVPEAFIVLWALSHGLMLEAVPLVWATASAAKMAVALPAGTIADRVGHAPVLLGGWLLRVLILALLSVTAAGGVLVWILFIAYAVSLALTEPSERAFIGNHTPLEQRGTAYGWYYLLCGVLVLPGSLLFGVIWQRFGEPAAFMSAAALTALTAMTVVTLGRRRAWTEVRRP